MKIKQAGYIDISDPSTIMWSYDILYGFILIPSGFPGIHKIKRVRLVEAACTPGGKAAEWVKHSFSSVGSRHDWLQTSVMNVAAQDTCLLQLWSKLQLSWAASTTETCGCQSFCHQGSLNWHILDRRPPPTRLLLTPITKVDVWHCVSDWGSYRENERPPRVPEPHFDNQWFRQPWVCMCTTSTCVNSILSSIVTLVEINT